MHVKIIKGVGMKFVVHLLTLIGIFAFLQDDGNVFAQDRLASNGTSKSGLTCEVVIYPMQSVSLPQADMAKSRLQPSVQLDPNKPYEYTLRVLSSDLNTKVVNKITITPMAGPDEPASFQQIWSPLGPCAISSEKRITCSIYYQFSDELVDPLSLMVIPNYDEARPYTSLNVFVETDSGNASCTSMNQIKAAATKPSPVGQLNSVSGFKVDDYRKVPDSAAVDAMISWQPLAGAGRYEIVRIGTNEETVVGTTNDTVYVIRFNPESVWKLAVYPIDVNSARGQISELLTITFPSQTAISYNPSPSPVAQEEIIEAVSQDVFDSSKIAVLEEKIEDLERRQIEQSKTINILESLVSRLRSFLNRFFGFK